jgi:hypothetical protein
MRHRRTNRFTHRAPDGTYITVYRSREPVLDCWTATLNSPEWDSSVNRGKTAMLGMSETASGYSEFTEGDEGPHLGKKVPWNEVPDIIKRHIMSRISYEPGQTSPQAPTQ